MRISIFVRPSQVSLVFDRSSGEPPHAGAVPAPGSSPTAWCLRSTSIGKKTRIKQYHKEGEALRTETTINDTRDFAIGRRIENLPELRKIWLCVQPTSARRSTRRSRSLHRRSLLPGYANDLIAVNDQRAAALRFADPRVQALLYRPAPVPPRPGHLIRAKMYVSILLQCWV